MTHTFIPFGVFDKKIIISNITKIYERGENNFGLSVPGLIFLTCMKRSL